LVQIRMIRMSHFFSHTSPSVRTATSPNKRLSRLILGVCLWASPLFGERQIATPATAARPQFEVASVRLHKPSATSSVQSNVPLGPGDIYTPTGGVFKVEATKLINLIAFAYRMTDAQLDVFRQQAPDWVLRTRFDIEARTDDQTVTKDGLRLMVQSLLAERFHLAMHHEMRQSSSFALLLVKSGVTGPRLHAHPDSAPCSRAVPAPAVTPEGAALPAMDQPETVPGGYPAVCGGIIELDSATPGQVLIGGRAVRFGLLTDSLASWGRLEKPVINETGLTGNYDFLLEYTPQARLDETDSPANAGPTFQKALEQQLGLRLQSQKNAVDFLVLDHVDEPTEN
jgi:uncharacterized protein (TIGR03435 family)